MQTKPRLQKIKLIAKTELAPDYWLLTFSGWRTNARAGQFAMVQPSPDSRFDPLLKRPLSFLTAEDDRVEFLVAVRGIGTKLLVQLNLGESIDAIGPLGRPFPVPAEGSRVALVAGGVGVPPLAMFAAQIADRAKVVAFLGARTRALLLLTDRFAKTAQSVYVATDDGSAGFKGTVAEALEQALKNGERFDAVYTCGPEPMMKAVANLCTAYEIPTWVSVEERMACGVGVCLGCAVRLANGGYAHVCTDGPVFAATELADYAGGKNG